MSGDSPIPRSSRRRQWPGWLLVGLGAVGFVTGLSNPPETASMAETLGYWSVPVILVVGGVVLLARATRGDRSG